MVYSMEYNILSIPVLILIGEQLLYNVVLVSAVQQRKPGIRHIYPLPYPYFKAEKTVA